MRKHITYANVVSTMALVLAMAGGAVAATQMAPKDSVNSRSIKNNTVRSPDVKNRSLLAKDFKAGQLPTGEKGDKGDPGSARGYAQVNYNGTINATSSSSNVTVNKIGTGEYCIGLSNGTVTNAVATIERQDGQTTFSGTGAGILTHVEIAKPGAAVNGCASGQLEVDTMLLTSTPQGDHVNLSAVDEPFFVVIP